MNDSDKKQDLDPIDLLRRLYPCISTAISFELEHGNYSEIERLQDLKRKVEKLIL